MSTSKLQRYTPSRAERRYIMKFDKIEYEILKCGLPFPKGGGYYTTEEHAQRALELMDEGILQYNPIEEWHISGWKLTEKGQKYCNEFMKKVQQKHSHVWLTNRDNDPGGYDDDSTYGDEVDIFALEYGHHNGPECKKCGFSFCHHCTSEFDIEPCSKRLSSAKQAIVDHFNDCCQPNPGP